MWQIVAASKFQIKKYNWQHTYQGEDNPKSALGLRPGLYWEPYLNFG